MFQPNIGLDKDAREKRPRTCQPGRYIFEYKYIRCSLLNIYIFKGLILPERAQISFGPFKAVLKHLTTGNDLTGKINVVLNQLTVWIYCEDEWDVHDLRNIVKTWVSNTVSIFGYVFGHAYEVEIRQILCDDKNIDYVFGIDNQAAYKEENHQNASQLVKDIMGKTSGEYGIYIMRCFNDLTMALKHVDDTYFYCFRAIESLKQYCRYKFNIESENDQWKKLSELTSADKDAIKFIRKRAFPERHGDICPSDANDISSAIKKTWEIVEHFLNKI